MKDLTKEKIRDEKLEDIESYQRALLSCAIVARTDKDGKIFFANDLFVEISGYSRDELIGSDHRILSSGHHSKDFFKALWSTILSGKIWRGQIKNKAKDGRFYWVDISICPIVEENGSVSGFFSFQYDISTQKSLEQQLNEAQSVSKVGSWSYDLLTKEQIWSDEHYKIFEIDSPQPQDVLFKLYRDRIHPDDLIELDRLVARAMEYGENFIYNHRVYLDNGQRIKHVQGIGNVTKDKNGIPIYISGTCRDRSFDVESESKYQRLLESMDEGYIVLDASGKIIKHNSSSLRILDLTAEQLYERSSDDPLWKAIKEDGSEFLGSEHPAMITLKTGKSVSNVVMGLCLANGEVRWIRINSVSLETVAGKKVLATFSDITALVSALKENRFLLDTVGVGTWKYNPINQNLVWDKSMYELYELDPNEFSGDFSAWESSLTPESRAQATHELTLALIGEKEFDTSFEIQTKSGRTKYISTRGTVIRDSNNQATMMYGINWDTSKEKELEKKLELEKAKAFHNSKLASIGQLAAGVGHEINNPLTIISGQLSLAEQDLENLGIKNEKLFERFKKLRKATERITNIVKGLRIFARTDDHAQVCFDVGVLINETFDMLVDIYLRENVKVTLNGVINNVFVCGNRGRIQQVLVNLISNAKDATKTTKDRIVDVDVSHDEGHVKIEVRDNGCGIPDSIKSNIFDPFFTTKEVNSGTGLGLSIVNSIIKEHNGKLDFSSEVGIGTTFTIYLPIGQKDQVVNTPSAEVKSQVTKTLLKYSVLAVDDEEDILEILGNALSNICMEVHLAKNAMDAMKILETKYVDLVISDIKMPDIDGIQMARILRDVKNYTGKLVLMTGGVEMTDDHQRAIGQLCDGLLLKPFADETLKSKITELFSGKK